MNASVVSFLFVSPLLVYIRGLRRAATVRRRSVSMKAVGGTERPAPLPGETGLSPEASFHPLNNEGNHGLCASRCVPTRICLCLRVRAPVVIRVSFLSGAYLRGCPVVSGKGRRAANELSVARVDISAAF